MDEEALGTRFSDMSDRDVRIHFPVYTFMMRSGIVPAFIHP